MRDANHPDETGRALLSARVMINAAQTGPLRQSVSTRIPTK